MSTDAPLPPASLMAGTAVSIIARPWGRVPSRKADSSG